MNRLLLAGMVAVLSVGCCTVHISSPGTLAGVNVKGAGGRADRAIMIANEGYYLFQVLPIVCGNVRWNEKAGRVGRGCVLFSDQLTAQRMMNALCKYAEREHADLVDVVINDKYQAPIGLFDIKGWFSTIIGYNNVTYSGVLVKREESK